MSQEKKAVFSRPESVLLALAAIMLIGAFLRFYHFPDWLHFELDQARDARVLDDALSGGPGELTLLGMKAGGTALRLGPGFYYLQYLSGLVFGDSPAGIATFIPILSVLSIPLFFLFAGRFFSVRLSLGLTLLFSVSAFMTMYGRFAWNPNPIPFFALLGLYSLLRSVEPEAKHAGRWFILSAFAIGILTHLHFLAFLSLPTITAVFLIIRRPRFSGRVWTLALAAGLLLYVPVVLNEISTGGANSKAFLGAVTEKSAKEQHSVAAKFVKDVTEHSLGYLVMVSGYEGGGFFDFGKTSSQEKTFISCNAACQNGWLYGALSLAIFSSAAVSLCLLWWKEKNRRRADMLLLSGLWLVIPFMLFLPLSYGFAPRFFLVASPLPFLLLGFLAEGASRLFPWKRFVRWGTFFCILVLALSNLYYLSQRFDQMSRARYEPVTSPPDRILKELIRVTMGQQEEIASYLNGLADSTGYPLYFTSEPQYQRSLKYLLQRDGIRETDGIGDAYEEGVYAIVIRTKADPAVAMRKYADRFDMTGIRRFGTLKVVEMRPKPEAIQAKREKFDGSLSTNHGTLPRYTWKGWWEHKAGAWDDDTADAGNNQ